MLGASWNDINVMIQAKEDGCDIHALNESGFNAYLLGATLGFLNVMERSRDDGCDIHALDELGRNAYHIGARCGVLRVMSQAKNDGVDINEMSVLRYHPFPKQPHRKKAKVRLNALDLAYIFDHEDCVEQAIADGVLNRIKNLKSSWCTMMTIINLEKTLFTNEV